MQGDILVSLYSLVELLRVFHLIQKHVFLLESVYYNTALGINIQMLND